MKVSEIIGILVVQCEKCGKKFVVNTEMIKDGFSMNCCRNTEGLLYDKVTVTLERQVNYGSIIDRETLREYKSVITHGQAMPLEEYKRMLASVILEGRKYRIASQHKNVVNVKVDTVDYENLYATLRTLGLSKEEAIDKVDIAIEQGFVRDTEIIKYILSLN
jgi:hypothetical protein